MMIYDGKLASSHDRLYESCKTGSLSQSHSHPDNELKQSRFTILCEVTWKHNLLIQTKIVLIYKIMRQATAKRYMLSATLNDSPICEAPSGSLVVMNNTGSWVTAVLVSVVHQAIE